MKEVIIIVATLLLLASCTEKPSTPAPKKNKVETKEQVTKPTKKSAPKRTVSDEHYKEAVKLLKSVSDKDVADVDAAKKFKIHCAACHGIKGNMVINGSKDLSISKLPLEESVAQVYFGKGLMTPFKGVMSDAEIVAVAKYIEGFR